MLPVYPEKFDKYVSSGMYQDENGRTIGADGLHISADAPERVKEFFRKENEAYKRGGWRQPYVIH